MLGLLPCQKIGGFFGEGIGGIPLTEAHKRVVASASLSEALPGLTSIRFPQTAKICNEGNSESLHR